ncbi:zinc finger protein [Macleaya cordata]|uniref:Zinc finger protein n=1 Tax=Macleaya cordata TaxID=56857 RepID=A0A200RCR0_MACCD|nr:zinc finger protein [Macleaya cordata]
MWQKQPNKLSYKESIKALEADIQHANSLSVSLPRDYGGECLKMRLSFSPLAPLFLFLIEWMDCSCTDTLPNYLGLLHILIYKVHVDGKTTMSSHERRASIREFYAVIYPSLQLLEGDLTELEDKNKLSWCMEVSDTMRVKDRKMNSNEDPEIEDECGICMEACTKMVLPNCGHSLCISCFHDWNVRSQSCPFCRGSLKRVSSNDLWVLTSNGDVVDTATLAKENLRRFYLYIDSLPLVIPDTLFFVHDYMI